MLQQLERPAVRQRRSSPLPRPLPDPDRVKYEARLVAGILSEGGFELTCRQPFYVGTVTQAVRRAGPLLTALLERIAELEGRR